MATNEPKYLGKYRTKRELLSAIKNAEANALFFSRDTMRFFGRQTLHIHEGDAGPVLVINFLEKCPRVSVYDIDAETLKLKTRPK